MEERSNTNIIPKNVAQSGYVLMFRIPNFIEAILIIGICLLVAYFIPVHVVTWKKLLVGGGIGFIPASLSLIGIKGETLTRVIINLIRNKKLAKIYEPPSDAYKRDYKRRQLEAEFAKENGKGSKKRKRREAKKKGEAGE